VALGLYYLSGLMTKETLDFKQLDASSTASSTTPWRAQHHQHPAT
jgi:hypothetical protein